MIELIHEPTKKQEDQFDLYRKRWEDYGLSTEPIDKERAREAVMKSYDGAGATRPNFILFVESPFQLYYAKPIWNRVCENLTTKKLPKHKYDPVLWYLIDTDKPLRLRAIDRIFSEIMREVSPDVDFGGDREKYMNFFGWLQHEWLNEPNFIDNLAKEASDEVGVEIYGQHETWLCYYEWQESIGAKGCEVTHGLQEVAKSAGWWIPYDTVAIVADRPQEIHVDAEGRLHSHTRPALLYRDGWSYCASHGMRIPSYLIFTPEALTVEKINQENNLEIKRVMLELFTLERYLEESDAVLIDSNEDHGELYRIKNSFEDMYLLKVINATPEPDGSSRVYIIRVPPDMKTAKQARAWTFGFAEEEFYPIIET